MRRPSASFGAPRRVWSVLGLALIILTHHQAAAAGRHTRSCCRGLHARRAPAASASTSAGSAGAAPASNNAAVWQAVSDSLAKVMSDTLATRPNNISAADMVQSAADMLRGIGTGKNLQNLQSMLQSGSQQATMRPGGGNLADQVRVTNNDLLNAFDQLRATAKRLGVALPANSPALDTWGRIADALNRGTGNNLMSAMPALVGNGGAGLGGLGAMAGARAMGQGAGGAAAMGQTAEPYDFPITPADYRIALATLANLGADAFLNGPGALLSLVSLGLGLTASILGIVGGALFIAGASTVLGAGIDSLDPNKIQKYRDSSYVQQFAELARDAETSLLPAALNPQHIQTVDWAVQVLQRTIRLAELRQN